MGRYNALFQAIALGASVMGAQASAQEFTGDQIRDMFFDSKGEVSYPECVYNGSAVEVRESDLMQMMHGRGNPVALAAQDGDGPYIMVNAEMLSAAHPSFMAFVMRHECKHLQSGHIAHFSREHYAEREDEADCQAIQELRAEGFTRDDLAIVEEYNRALQQAFYPAQRHKDAATARNERIRACYREADDVPIGPLVLSGL